jgi:DNA polymerase-3 subunit delta'
VVRQAHHALSQSKGACRRIEKGTHPDVRVVEIEEGASIKIAQAREVIALAGYRPYEGRRRVVIIDPADALEKDAQNALLKTLEETPPASIFVLVTARADALLPTIRSRCPQIRFGGLTVAEIARVLVGVRGLGEPEARAAAIVAGGSVARAIEAASEETTGARSQALALLQDASASRDPRRLLERMKTVLALDRRQGGGATAAEEREQVTLSLRALASLLRDVTLLQVQRGSGSSRDAASDLANADLVEDLERVAASLGRQRAAGAFAAVDRALSALGGNANPKLVVDWLAFQM